MQNDIIPQNYFVIFLDHLGQREKLRKETGLFTSEQEKEEFRLVLEKTAGRILKSRDIFKDFFVGYKEGVKELPESQKPDIDFYGMSDSIIIAMPLTSHNENSTAIHGVETAFRATCGLGLWLLSDKIPMRGGLEVGVATKIDEKEIYGPAFERAYYIESQLAEYPRFVVGDELRKYISDVENQEPTTFYGGLIGELAPERAKLCKKMILRDSDGRYMLDFLGATVKEGLDGLMVPETIKKAYEFVKSEYENFSEKDDHKLTARYYRLLRYFESRLSVWGIDKT